MIKLDKNHRQPACDIYFTKNIFYPLIGAVLLDKQNGTVFVNDAQSISQVYVEHQSGFSQVFGSSDINFEREIEIYLLQKRQFSPEKVRLYCPSALSFTESLEKNSELSYRQRFVLDTSKFKYELGHYVIPNEHNVILCEVNKNNIKKIDKNFNLVNRFWRNPDDFIRESMAIIATCGGQMVSICYAAAVANNSAEIDVLTLKQYRSKGLAKLAVMEFLKRCLEDSITPLWDCFTNNSGSMALAKSVGFYPLAPEYNFFTIKR
jgi:hypothetical protein